MLSVKVGDRVVSIGDDVKYIVAGQTGVRPARVLDVADGAHNLLNLLVGKRVVKSVEFGRRYGTWTF